MTRYEYVGSYCANSRSQFHVFDVMLFIIWSIMMQRLIYFAHNQLFAAPIVHRRRRFFWALVSYMMIFGPAVPFLLYASFFDGQGVYGVYIARGLCVLGVAVVLLIVTSPLLCFIYCCYLGDRRLDPRWLRESEFQADGDRLTMAYARATGKRAADPPPYTY